MKETINCPDYTFFERMKLADKENISSNCPNCGHFWLRDYDYPVRNCPQCGLLKLWADPMVGWTLIREEGTPEKCLLNHSHSVIVQYEWKHGRPFKPKIEQWCGKCGIKYKAVKKEEVVL